MIKTKDRIKELRNTLGLNQVEFAEKLGVTNAAISRIESGERNVTEQMIRSICREFGASYLWLTTGAGAIFEEKSEEAAFYEMIDRVLASQNHRVRNIFKNLSNFTDEDWAKMEEVLDKLLAGYEPEPEPANDEDEDFPAGVKNFISGYKQGYKAYKKLHKDDEGEG